jgi:hypothetical protein
LVRASGLWSQIVLLIFQNRIKPFNSYFFFVSLR